MRTTARRTAATVAGLATVAVIAAGCGADPGEEAAPAAATATQATGTTAPMSTTASGSPSASVDSTPSSGAAVSVSGSASSGASASSASGRGGTVELQGVNGSTVTLTGPIGAKYLAATPAQKKGLGAPLDGSHNAGTRDSGLVYQQFKGGVITSRTGSGPAYITWGRIRDAWNIERDSAGKPLTNGEGANGSAGPLGAPTSDETVSGDLRQTTFEHGKIVFNAKTGAVTVTVKGKTVPAGL